MDIRRPELKRFVIVIGPTGSGKSTVSNMLFNGESTPDACVKPFPVGGTADSVTKRAAIQVNLSRGLCVLDTVGIGDPALDEIAITRSIRGLIRDTVAGVHAIIVVMKIGRVSYGDRVNMDLLTELFRTGDLKSRGVLLVTHWEGELGDEEEDLREWIGTDSEMMSMVSQFAKVVLTNNSLKGRFADPSCRAARLQELTEFIDNSALPILPKPINVADFVKQILRKFVRFFVQRPAVYLDQLAGWIRDQENAFPTWCGDCTVCMEPINISDVCQLACEHSFHQQCVERLDPQVCPLCRVPFQAGLWFAFKSF